MKKKHLFLFAGEQSGDLHGGKLLRQLIKKQPQSQFTGVGGMDMREAGLECTARSEDFEVMGFTEVIKHLPQLYRQFYHVRNTILARRPDAAILIDYPGFNLRMAAALRKQGYQGKIVQYISPTFWAWGKGRVPYMERNLDLLLSIYPFEEKLLSETTLNTRYVGNPVWEEIQQHRYHDEWFRILGIKRIDSLVAIFPGSRKREIRDNLPDLIQTAVKLKMKNPDYLFAISCANVELMGFIQRHLQGSPLKYNRDLFLVPKSYRYELMRDSRSAIAKCGSVTLELALHQCPTVVVYRASAINRFIAKHIIRLKLEHFSIANILLGHTVFPEHIKENYTPDQLVRTFREIDAEGPVREQCISGCKQIREMIAGRSASENSADAILELL